jgi:outer membrane protein assembly factor BamD
MKNGCIIKMFKSIISVFLCLSLIIFISCSRHHQKEALTAEEAFHKAMDKFSRGKYLDASEQLSVVTLNYSGSAIIDSAQYFLAESHFRMKEYLIAASEFERLIYQFPSSHLCDNAKYKIGLSYYKMSPHYGLDQEYTRKSIDEFQEFTEFYPSSDLVPEVLNNIHQARTKLARKAFMSGELYYKMGDYESALIYLNEVLDNYYDTEYAPVAILKKGECYMKMKQMELARENFLRVKEQYPHHPSATKAQNLLNRIGGN